MGLSESDSDRVAKVGVRERVGVRGDRVSVRVTVGSKLGERPVLEGDSVRVRVELASLVGLPLVSDGLLRLGDRDCVCSFEVLRVGADAVPLASLLGVRVADPPDRLGDSDTVRLEVKLHVIVGVGVPPE